MSSTLPIPKIAWLNSWLKTIFSFTRSWRSQIFFEPVLILAMALQFVSVSSFTASFFKNALVLNSLTLRLLDFVTPDSRVRVVLSPRSGLVLSLVVCGEIGPSTASLANQAPVYCGCPAGTHGWGSSLQGETRSERQPCCVVGSRVTCS